MQTEELRRYHYEKYDDDSKEVRLIVKLTFFNRAPLVIKFKNEEGVTRELITEQIMFSEHLSKCGIPTANFYRSGDSYVVPKALNGYDVLITLEDYREGEIKRVNLDVAQKTGKLLAATHNIAQRDDCHVNDSVLFDPFKENDLFSYGCFEQMREAFSGDDAQRFSRIVEKYRSHMDALSPLLKQKKYMLSPHRLKSNMPISPLSVKNRLQSLISP